MQPTPLRHGEEAAPAAVSNHAPAAVQPDLAAESRVVIQQGSKSFAAAAALFDPATRLNAELLYAWCRHCDDVVDGQVLGFGMTEQSPELMAATVAELRAKTDAALAGEPPAEPAFAGLQQVARATGLPARYPHELLDGFALDAAETRYDGLENVLTYCWHVAGVVGVMMAVVMDVRPDDLPTLRRAQDLGLAFQLTNIARDVVEDAEAGRIYLPLTWLAEAGVAPQPAAVAERANRPAVAAVARRLVAAAEPFYASARHGLPALPLRCAWAVAAAGGVYRRIGTEVVGRGDTAWDTRVSTSKAAKLGAVLAGGVAALGSRLAGRAPERGALWSRI